MRPDRRRLLMVAVLVMLLGVVAWTYFGRGRQTTPATPAAASGDRRPGGAAADALPAAEGVRLSSLEHTRSAPSDATRNPFTFGRRGGGAGRGGTDEPLVAPIFTPAPAEPAAPSGPAGPPPIPLKFIGVLDQGEGRKWAVLTVGEGRMPLHGKEGDIIDGRYRIVKIGTESIEMVYLDGRGRQTIRLTGQ